MLQTGRRRRHLLPTCWHRVGWLAHASIVHTLHIGVVGGLGARRRTRRWRDERPGRPRTRHALHEDVVGIVVGGLRAGRARRSWQRFGAALWRAQDNPSHTNWKHGACGPEAHLSTRARSAGGQRNASSPCPHVTGRWTCRPRISRSNLESRKLSENGLNDSFLGHWGEREKASSGVQVGARDSGQRSRRRRPRRPKSAPNTM